jgi:hypothetical protein
MTDELFVSPTDLAEALGCPIHTVMTMIENGDVSAVKRRGWKIPYSEVAGIVAEFRRAAWELGQTVQASPQFTLSRPVDRDGLDSPE